MTASAQKPTLTERYVRAVLRSVPSSQRDDLEPEIRALVADAIEARTADGQLDPDDAERAALTELGDPAALAARYTGATLHLIGPQVYPIWLRTVTMLLVIVVPIAGIGVLVAKFIEGATVGQAIFGSISTAFQVVVHMTFWFTLVFAIIERVAGSQAITEAAAEVSAEANGKKRRSSGVVESMTPHVWTVDDLPELPDDGRIGMAEFVATLVFNVFVIGALLWVQLVQPITIDGTSYPLFDPALWSFWLPWFLIVLGLEIVFTLVLWARGHYTWVYAIVNAVLGAAFIIPAVYLLLNGLLFDPALVAAVTAETGTEWIDVTGKVVAASLILIVVYDAVDGFMKARRGSRAFGC